MFRSIRWRIAIPHMLLILAAMVGLALYISEQVRQTRLGDLEAQLLAEARLIADQAGPVLSGEGGEDLDALAKHWSAVLNVRVTIIGADGIVLGESHEDRAQMDNHLSRPEVQQALATGTGRSTRFSHTVRYDMLYVALPAAPDGQLAGFARLALSLEQVEAYAARLRQTILLATLLTTLLAMLLALLIAGRTTRPVRELTRVAERIVAGDLRARLFLTSRDEVGQLSLTFNRMADYMQAEMDALARERSRLAGVLDNMADGVIFTDREGRVLLINPAAARLLGAAESGDAVLSFAQLVRHHQLIELWKRCRESGREQIDLLQLSHKGLFLQATVTPLRREDGSGFLVILQDLTRLRHLEKVRQDFVSNVSHELLTPLASLKALVDTLRDGILDDPAAAQRFLGRIETEVDALTQMVQELLELSRIESGRVPLRLRPVDVVDVIVPPAERLRPQAVRAGLELTLHVPSGLPFVLADPERVQQVVTNLVHNAIKFTPQGGKVSVSAEQVQDEVVISVRDTGVGIPSEDVPRIFERFYKADRARSGGGTGLGLSIAKHIVQGHGGRIWVESREDQGSTFSFSLPIGARK